MALRGRTHLYQYVCPARKHVLVLSHEKKCDICCIVFFNQNRCINILVSLTNDLINRCSYLTNKCTFYFQKVNQCFSAQ